MLLHALPVALVSAALFSSLALMSDRPRGAFLAQIALAFASALVFVAIIAEGPLAGLPPQRIAGFGVGLMAAAVAGMLYHLYLGRFDSVWRARAVFTLVYLVTAGLFGFVFLSLF
jgi:hypothetical protein